MVEKVDRAKLLSVIWRSDPGVLTEKQRQLIDLRLQGIGYAAIGRRLKISADAAREMEAQLVARVRDAD
jgi:DNA-binding CsgD family transcriptional regulator